MSDDAGKPSTPFVVVNAETATFECTYGRGCAGLCCRNGRPPVTRQEAERIDANIGKVLPHLRPEARKLIEASGYLSRRGQADSPMARVVAGWCVFFSEGCVLHKIGATEGDKYRYKPAPCSLFPLAQDHKGRWQVRQRGYNGELWDLFCLDPAASAVPATLSLTDEIALAKALHAKD
jgi:Fe-S-cluster containining protein